MKPRRKGKILFAKTQSGIRLEVLVNGEPISSPRIQKSLGENPTHYRVLGVEYLNERKPFDEIKKAINYITEETRKIHPYRKIFGMLNVPSRIKIKLQEKYPPQHHIHSCENGSKK